jgi:hypothetical protein
MRVLIVQNQISAFLAYHSGGHVPLKTAPPPEHDEIFRPLTYLRISVPSEVTVRTTGRVIKNDCASSSETGTPLQASRFS